MGKDSNVKCVAVFPTKTDPISLHHISDEGLGHLVAIGTHTASISGTAQLTAGAGILNETWNDLARCVLLNYKYNTQPAVWIFELQKNFEAPFYLYFIVTVWKKVTDSEQENDLK